MKEKPKVFHNDINKKFNNNKDVFYSKNDEDEDKDRKDRKSINQKINEIFSSPNYVYKANVEIVLEDKTINKRIIGRNKNYLITMDNSVIPIKDIVDIKSIKKH